MVKIEKADPPIEVGEDLEDLEVEASTAAVIMLTTAEVMAVVVTIAIITDLGTQANKTLDEITSNKLTHSHLGMAVLTMVVLPSRGMPMVGSVIFAAELVVHQVAKTTIISTLIVPFTKERLQTGTISVETVGDNTSRRARNHLLVDRDRKMAK